MGRQRKKRCLKNKKDGAEEGTSETQSVLNSGVTGSSTVSEPSSKVVAKQVVAPKEVFKPEEKPINCIDTLPTVNLVRIQPPPSCKTDTPTEVQRIEPLESPNIEKDFSSTTEVRMQRTTLKVHISRCIRRRTWPNIKRDPKEFKTTPEDLMITYAINAYQYWARIKNKDITKGSKRYKEDILAVPLHQWNKVLSSFIQSMTDPNGRSLSGGAILYIVLGLQLYIFAHNRADNLFFDESFSLFSRTLCEILASREKAIQYGRSLSLIEEETLWISGQLGSHSPVVLLTSVIYFNTKYFKLRTVKSHSNLKFKNIFVYDITNSVGKRSSAITFEPDEVIDITEDGKEEIQELQNKDEIIYDQQSIEDSVRCPVLLYKFYVSKCPKSSRGKDEKVYLNPIKECTPEAEYWFSPEPLAEVKIFKMLQFFRYVQEVKQF